MAQDEMIGLFSKMLWMCVLLAAPPLLAALGVGLVIGLLQAITSIQEQTLTFVPKVIIIVLVFIFGGGWMLRMLMNFTSEVIVDLPRYGGL